MERNREDYACGKVATLVFTAFPLLLLLRNRLVTLLKLSTLRGVERWHGSCVMNGIEREGKESWPI